MRFLFSIILTAFFLLLFKGSDALMTAKKKRSKQQELEQEHVDDYDGDEIEPMEFENQADLKMHLKNLNKKVNQQNSNSRDGKYIVFPDEKPISETEMAELRRQELRNRVKVQETLDEFGRLSPEHAKALHMYGASLHKQRRFDDLLVVAQEIVKIHEEIDGPEHYNTGRALDNLGSAAFRVRDEILCEKTMKRALYIFIKRFGAKSKEVSF